jgi:pimeloyl-ACP methyl ester carboxylesterase
VSYSLCGDIGARGRSDPSLGFENYVRQLDAVLDAAGLQRAAICGVSYGGLVALRYAARSPERVSALVLASAPGPDWQPNNQQAGWISRPWWSTPAFVLSSPARVWPEISAAVPSLPARIGFVARQGLRCAAAPMIPSLMASRIRCAAPENFRDDCDHIRSPTLVLTGEPDLDRVVPVQSTRSYVSLIRNAGYVMLERTGHMGLLTQPVRFADIVTGFVHAHHH